ncbi:MAG: hypothetical protein HDT20_03980 [Oscillibacter sp.]|nr:hypothetical protein [Oscillibacter sp.]
MPEWLSMTTLVDAAGIAGFILSLSLAVSQLWAKRLRIKASDGVLVKAHYAHDLVFLHVCLYNRTDLPFSLIDIHVNAGRGHRNVPIEKTVRTYCSKGGNGKLPVGPVVLSREFPVRFDSYAAEVFLLEVGYQHIDMKFLRLDDSLHSQAEHPRRRFPQIHMPCKRPPRLRLKLRTSRGRLSVPVQIVSVQGREWLETYAAQKAGYKEKILFP